jgi:hypothetical protein
LKKRASMLFRWSRVIKLGENDMRILVLMCFQGCPQLLEVVYFKLKLFLMRGPGGSKDRIMPGHVTVVLQVIRVMVTIPDQWIFSMNRWLVIILYILSPTFLVANCLIFSWKARREEMAFDT